MRTTEETNRVLAEWFLLPELIKQDILKIEIKQTRSMHGEKLYSDFILDCDEHLSGNKPYSLVTNKFRRLKSHLFGCYC